MKAFVVHFITFVISVITVLYIIGDEQTTAPERTVVCIFIALCQLIAVGICDTHKFYKSKT